MYVPLVLAYARTIHKFQGMSAGRTDPGQIPNMYTVIICEPGGRDAERLCPGTLYTAVSRATTLGDENGIGSALYFLQDLRRDTIEHVLYKKNSTQKYKKVMDRDRWVQHLKKGLLPDLTYNFLTDTHYWAENHIGLHCYTDPFLKEKILEYSDFLNQTTPTFT